MLDKKLNEKLFEENTKQIPTRDGFGEGLLELGKENRNVVALCADLTESTRMEAFAKEFPERFFQVGVAEQNLATIAAGLGVSGKIPFIASYAVFSPGRNYEQIRTTICYNDANVKIVGAHAGISVGPDGATHQATEDIAIMRVLPNMKVFVPCDAEEARKITHTISKMWGPAYIRITREKSPVITGKDTPFHPGKAEIFWKSKKPEVVIFACGPVIHKALKAAKELEKEKIGTVVVNVHTIKPIDEKGIVSLAEKYGAVVSVEEHQTRGGLGGAISEVLAKHSPTPMEFIGMEDTFGESGKPEELYEKYGMSEKNIKEKVKEAIRRKKP